uniref:Uncharacterized protein n=1 Tax=Malurus cyaneus samueli TaxID=2593467 RepID=A0A8C5T937_9PASS
MRAERIQTGNREMSNNIKESKGKAWCFEQLSKCNDSEKSSPFSVLPSPFTFRHHEGILHPYSGTLLNIPTNTHPSTALPDISFDTPNPSPNRYTSHARSKT